MNENKLKMHQQYKIESTMRKKMILNEYMNKSKKKRKKNRKTSNKTPLKRNMEMKIRR